jgi:CRP-like cAMP-binding protein
MRPARLDSSQAQPVVRRLCAFRQLTEAGVAAVEKALQNRILRAGAHEDLISEGDKPDGVRMLLSGWLCRYKTLEDGRRQIVNFVLPGDTCDAHVFLLSAMDHSIGTLTPVVYAELDRVHFDDLVASDRLVAEALWCETLAGNAVQREWAVNLGRRVALERVAHLLCEIFERLRPVGLTDGKSCAFPVTQMDLADATGLSTVHVNRTLQELRASGLITLRERQIIIHDLEGLSSMAMFTPYYLHMERR